MQGETNIHKNNSATAGGVAKECRFCRSRKMLQNARTLAIVAVDTEENERLKFGVNYSIYSFHY